MLPPLSMSRVMTGDCLPAHILLPATWYPFSGAAKDRVAEGAKKAHPHQGMRFSTSTKRGRSNAPAAALACLICELVDRVGKKSHLPGPLDRTGELPLVPGAVARN